MLGGLGLRGMLRVALGAAVVAVLAFLPPLRLPVSPVPVTSQTLGVMLAGAVFGRRIGAWSLVIFLALLAAGAPVLAGGRAGIGVLAGPSAGYVLSWPLGAYVTGWVVERSPQPSYARLAAASALGGIVVVYLVGAPVLAWITGLGFERALVAGALVFLPGDLLKVFLAAGVAGRLRRLAATPLPPPAVDTPPPAT